MPCDKVFFYYRLHVLLRWCAIGHCGNYYTIIYMTIGTGSTNWSYPGNENKSIPILRRHLHYMPYGPKQPVDMNRISSRIAFDCRPYCMTADNNDIAVITMEILDAESRLVPVANNAVAFSLTGPGKLIGVGNGDCSSHEPDKASRRSAFNGLAQAIVQTSTKSGNITLKADAAGLKTGTVTLTSK